MMIEFGLLLKRFRSSNSLSQNQFVDLVTKIDNRLVGLDVVTISRWENRVVIPPHKRQVEVFQAMSQSYLNIILDNKDLINGDFDCLNRIKKYNVWENVENINFNKVNCKKLRAVDDYGNTKHCIIYTDDRGMPIGQLTYKYLEQSNFWNVLERPVSSGTHDSNTEICLQVNSIFCMSETVLPHMLGILIKQLLSKEVDIIGFVSKNRKSNVKKFLKSMGFKIHKENQHCTSLVLTYYDALYSKDLFYCAILVGVEGDIHA